MGLLIPKKHPRKSTLLVALTKPEKDALEREAVLNETSISSLARGMLIEAGLHDLVQVHLGMDPSVLAERRADHD